METHNAQAEKWLSDEKLFEIADSLIFEDRLDERLGYLYNTYASDNGIKMFDKIIDRLNAVKFELNKPLAEELKEWNSRILQEKAEGKIPDIEGLPKLADLRRDQGYPTNTLFPKHWHKMPHISWQHVEEVRFQVSFFKKEKKLQSLKVEVENILSNADRLTNKTELTNRQRILVHFYEDGKMLTTDHKDYNDYILFATPSKRLAYPNESISKLKHLIKDIEKVIPHLSEKASQQAEKELNTLKLRLTVEK